MTEKKQIELNKPKKIRDYGETNKVFDRKGVYASYRNQIWGFDLIDMEDAGYVMNIIDIFSRKAESEILNSKSSEAIKKGLIKIFEKFGDKPERIWTDKEAGLYGLRPWLKEQGIEIYSLNNSYLGPNTHANPISERFNREVKKHMNKIRKEKKGRNFSQLIHETVRTFLPIYNNRFHRTIKTTPNEAYDTTKVQKIRVQHLRNLIRPREAHKPLRVGSLVLLQKNFKNPIKSKKETTYYEQPYIIIKVKLTNPITYVLDDIEGTFYRDQLKVIEEPSKKFYKEI